MEFQVLGPVTASEAGVPAQLPMPLQRRALALLLLRAGEPCPAGWLTEALWDGSPPASPGIALRQVIFRLRRGLGAALASRVQRAPDGYRLAVRAGELDLTAFRALAADGHALADQADHAAAERSLAAALRLWSNPPLPDLPEVLAVSQYRAGLLDQRRGAEDALYDARLALGQHQQVIGDIRALVTADPLREHTWAQLCTALYRAGRQADALAAAASARSALSRELGVDPGPELRQVIERMLTGDPALAEFRTPGSISAVQPRPAWNPVCQLPADPPGSCPPQLEAITASLVRPSSCVAVTVICGPPGARTTGLAVHAAHVARRAFPDGQLFAELTDGGLLRQPASILAGLLASLGVSGSSIPVDTPDRAALLRSLLAGLRVLVLATDATDAAQVRPLIPGTGGSAILVTAQGNLEGLSNATFVDLEAPGPGHRARPALKPSDVAPRQTAGRR